MRFILIWLLLCGTLSAQPDYKKIIESRGAQIQPGETWVLGLRGQSRGAYPDTIVVLLDDQTWEFPGFTGVEPPGLRISTPRRLKLAPDTDFLLCVGPRPFHYCLIDTAPVAQRFNSYQRRLLAQQERVAPIGGAAGGVRRLDQEPCVLALAGYPDTVVILGRDPQGNPQVDEFPVALPDLAPGSYQAVLGDPGNPPAAPQGDPGWTLAGEPANGFPLKQNFTLHVLDPEAPVPASTRYVLGKSVQGQPMIMTEIGAGPRVALYFATIHGDEAAGTAMLTRLLSYFEKHPESLSGWQVRVITRVNLDSQRRTNAHRVDLNRNFPEQWKPSARDDEFGGPAPLSEPESRCVQAAALGLWPGPAGRPSRIISLHQHSGLPSGQGLLDGDGPASVNPLIEAMIQTSAGRLTARKIPDSKGRLRIPGSFGTWVSSPGVNIPTVTFEVSHADLDEQTNWKWYGRCLIDFLASP